MGDAENALPPSKKRSAGRELTKDNAGLDDEEDAPEQEGGTFKRASEDVLATRRIVKVRRNQTTLAPSSNPFAGISLVPPKESNVASAEVTSEAQAAGEKTVSDDVDGEDDAEKGNEKGKDEENKQLESKDDKAGDESAVDKENAVEENSNIGSEATEPKIDNEQTAKEEKTEDEYKKDDYSEKVNSGAEGTPLSSFQQLSSSKNAFTGLAGTGISTSTFSFGSISKDGSALGASTASKSEGSGFPSKQEVVMETGEEQERVVFTADSVMFEFVDGGWKERGKGELKVNVSTTGTEKARLVMRARGNYRLILNASLYPDMKLTNMEKKGITFACVNSASEGKDGLSTFALKFKDASIVEEFRAAVTAHKSKTSEILKTPENSPKASDD
ncbi:nuclear pore complex protein NUP50A-like isoform X2 [Quercus robur]|uniref:nuclear pore complex protein NUP50A-like isoform X2 n=1 Tax=Quercus robur TaxID=38942 RepID=UPI002162EAB9|nr:nuclear pore complex protein NUP50A-like isoform X2 [Quercus robur]